MEHIADIDAYIFEFLANRSRGELQFSHNGWNYALLRSYYDKETDFLYLLCHYGSNPAQDLSTKAEYAGIYSHLTRKLYNPSYDIRFLNPTHCVELSDVYETLINAAKVRILQEVEGIQIPKADESIGPWPTREEYQQYYLPREAEEHFFNGTQPSYQPTISKDSLTIDVLITAINHPDAAAKQVADAYVTKNLGRIKRRLWELSLIPAKIAALEATNGNHHVLRNISRSIGDEKMVRIEILKDGHFLECRIEARALKATDSHDYSTWYMDAPSRNAFERTFGRSAKLSPADIQRICYGKKVLYQKQNT